MMFSQEDKHRLRIVEHNLLQLIDALKVGGKNLQTDARTILESQGKLLAAIHEETARVNALAAKRQEEFAELHVQKWFESLDGKVQAIGGVLAELLATTPPARKYRAANRRGRASKRNSRGHK